MRRTRFRQPLGPSGRGSAAGYLLALFAASAAMASDGDWSPVAVKAGVTVLRRPVVGSRYYEYRATTLVDAPVADVAEAIWRAITRAPGRTVRSRQVLRSSADEIVFYDVVQASFASDRDVTMRVRKRSGPDGTIQLTFESQNHLGPPPTPKRVRIPVVRGYWRVAPNAGGGALLTYVCYSEPGGSVPAVLVRSAQQSQIFDDIRRILGQLR